MGARVREIETESVSQVVVFRFQYCPCALREIISGPSFQERRTDARFMIKKYFLIHSLFFLFFSDTHT
jgi:hypothetical protein